MYEEAGMHPFLFLSQESLLTAAVFTVLLIILLIILYFKNKSNIILQGALCTDRLTGYPNYQALVREAPPLIKRAPGEYAIVYLDIYRFKTINDTLGYEAGDQVLIAASDILKEMIQQDERFARLYADVFVLLLRYTDQRSLAERMEGLAVQLARITLPDSSFKPLFCGGIYMLPENYGSIDKACDRANYAKDSISQHFTNSFVFYDDVMRSRILAEKELESSMQGALERGEFVPFYQPKVEIFTGRVAGAEALVRWQHPEQGLLLPGVFLPFYEKIGFIVKIDLFVFEQVCRDLQVWLSGNHEGVPVSINFSRRHMQDPDLPKRLKDIADHYQVPTRFLEVEVTETEELESVETASAFVAALKNYGFKVSIDDYGTGYSSISFLQQLPIDALKLDRGFMLNAMESDKARDIMRYLVTAVQRNGVRVICEGVEIKEQLEFVRSLDCRFVQGYFYSIPLPKEEFEKYLLQHGVTANATQDYLPMIDYEKNHWQGVEEFFAQTMPPRTVVTLDGPGDPVQYISPGFLSGMGYSQAEFQSETGALYANWIHPDDRLPVLEQIRQEKDSPGTLVLQYRLRKKDGTYVWIREENKRVLTESGQQVLLRVCTDVDNVVRLQLERGSLINAIPGGVGTLLLKEDGPHILQATDRFYEVIGYTKEQMEAMDNNLCSIFYQEELPAAMAVLEEFLKEQKDFCQCTFRIQLENGELHWVSFRGALSGMESGPRVTVIVFNSDSEVQAKLTLEAEKAKLELALASTNQAVFEYNISDKTIHSHMNFKYYGIEDGEVLHLPEDLQKGNFVHTEDMRQVMDVKRRIIEGEEHISYEMRILARRTDPASSYMWVRITLSTIFDEKHKPVRAVGIVENINQQKQYEYEFLQEAQYRRAFTESSLMAYEMNLTQNWIGEISGSRAIRINTYREKMEHPDDYSRVLAASAALVSAKDLERYMAVMSRDNLLNLYSQGIFEKELEYRRLTMDGQELWNAVLIYLISDRLTGDVKGYAYHRDIHDRKETEQGLIEQASRDSLTGVFNRFTAEQLIQNCLNYSGMPNRVQAFLMMDMDNFKQINDTCGHLVGDQCLIHLVQALAKHLREDDIIARMGGDEFAVFLKNLPDEEKAVSIAEKLAKAIKGISTELEMEIPTGVSIGIAVAPRHGSSFEELYRYADKAMYDAKRSETAYIQVADME